MDPDDTLRLIAPDAALRDELLAYVDEFGVDTGRWWGKLRRHVVRDFPALVARLAANARGERLLPDHVATEQWWLVRGGRILGTARLRLVLTPRLRLQGGHVGYDVRPTERGRGVATELLRRVLARANALGIDPALVTCDDDNVASARVIEKNGGVLLGKGPAPGKTVLVRRYRVPTAVVEARRRHD